MNSTTTGILLLSFVCCIWPVLFHFAWVWIANGAHRIDWQAIRWPWSKD